MLYSGCARRLVASFAAGRPGLALVAMSVMEQRCRAVMAVLDGASVSEVAVEVGVSRQSVHAWVRRYRAAGLAGLADRSRPPPVEPESGRGGDRGARVVSCDVPTLSGEAQRIVHEL